MPFRQIEVPVLGRRLSNVMAHPASAESDRHEIGLDEYYRLGGNCIHLHGEGGEVHSRHATGRWLDSRGLRAEFFLCTQICHDGWDDTAQRAIDRFTPAAVREDITADLALLPTRYLDLVYLDDNPRAPLEPVIEAIGREIAGGRAGAFGVRNWKAERIYRAQAYASGKGLPGIAAIVTTELALAAATETLWPEYVPFDSELREAVRILGLAVFSHAGDVNLGQCLYGDADGTASVRARWLQRWDHAANLDLVRRVRRIAAEHGVTTRTVNVAWVLSQPFPVIGVVSLPSLLNGHGAEYERASQWLMGQADMDSPG